MKRLIQTLGLVGMLGASVGLSGCGDDNLPTTFTLPNGQSISGQAEICPSGVYLDHKNLKLAEAYPTNEKSYDLVEKSRLEGTVTYLGFLKTDSNSISKTNYLNKGDIVMKLQVDDKYTNFAEEVIMQVNSGNDKRSPALIFEFLEKGDRVSIPTMRAYIRPFNLFKILNPLDEIRLSEIRKLPSKVTDIEAK